MIASLVEAVAGAVNGLATECQGVAMAAMVVIAGHSATVGFPFLYF